MWILHDRFENNSLCVYLWVQNAHHPFYLRGHDEMCGWWCLWISTASVPLQIHKLTCCRRGVANQSCRTLERRDCGASKFLLQRSTFRRYCLWEVTHNHKGLVVYIIITFYPLLWILEGLLGSGEDAGVEFRAHPEPHTQWGILKDAFCLSMPHLSHKRNCKVHLHVLLNAKLEPRHRWLLYIMRYRSIILCSVYTVHAVWDHQRAYNVIKWRNNFSFLPTGVPRITFRTIKSSLPGQIWQYSIIYRHHLDVPHLDVDRRRCRARTESTPVWCRTSFGQSKVDGEIRRFPALGFFITDV